MFKFYDTCSLLLDYDRMFSSDEDTPVICSITLDELENIKTASNRDEEIKYAARQVLHTLDANDDKYLVKHFKDEYLVHNKGFTVTNDLKIILTAEHFYLEEVMLADTVFITNDLSCKQLARQFYVGKKIISIEDNADDYQGFVEVYLSEDEMSDFYSNQDKNMFNLLINQYLLVYDKASGECVDRLCWTGNGYRHLNYGSFTSKYLGEVKPIKGDLSQSLLADSLINNKITMVKGPAGSGKTFLSLACLLHKLERGKIDKIIIFCNTVATKDSARLGYYPGTKDEKLLDSQIGNLLSSKLGGRIIVEQMINEEKLVLLPMSDIRGYDTSGMRAGIYISEAQNLSVPLMKLALERIGDDSICIIDGDCKAQVDDINFAGKNNGMRRASKVYRGEDVYGEVTLQIVHRSKIARIAERL